MTVVIYCVVLFVGGRNKQFYATFSFRASRSAALILFLHLHSVISQVSWSLDIDAHHYEAAKQLIPWPFQYARVPSNNKRKILKITFEPVQQGPLIGSRQELQYATDFGGSTDCVFAFKNSSSQCYEASIHLVIINHSHAGWLVTFIGGKVHRERCPCTSSGACT